jgi:hypothetical protein
MAQAATVNAIAFAALFGAATAEAADRFRLAPYKDDLFKYQHVIGEKYGGDFVFVEFLKSRDIGGRDEIELKKAFDKFVSLDVNESKKDLSIGKGDSRVRYTVVGQTEDQSKMFVIFLHGLHGDRSLPMEDHRFGGNFNRLKNLMALNGGTYLSPDFVDFGKGGAAQIAALIRHCAEQAPGAPIILGCASTGCKLVFRLLHNPKIAELLDGVALLGSLSLGSDNEGTFFDVSMFKDKSKRIPIYIGHGSADKTVSWVTQEVFFKRIKAAAPDYPIRYELFFSDDAVHGTPLRMVDWRLVLNWMLDAKDG